MTAAKEPTPALEPGTPRCGPGRGDARRGGHSGSERPGFPDFAASLWPLCSEGEILKKPSEGRTQSHEGE